MQLYVNDRNTGKKILLDISAKTREELARRIGGTFYVGNNIFNVNQVFAMSSSNDTAGGAVLGGLIGLMAGGIGVLAGGLIGGLIGSSKDNEELKKIRTFNNSHYEKIRL